MEYCFRCEKGDTEVQLLDAVYGVDMVKICENCSKHVNIPIISIYLHIVTD